MAKWMGFFLSEHTHVPEEKDEKKCQFGTELRLHGRKMDVVIAIVCRKPRPYYAPYRFLSGQNAFLAGKVSELYESEISLKAEEGYRRIAVEEILQIQLVDMNEYCIAIRY